MKVYVITKYDNDFMDVSVEKVFEKKENAIKFLEEISKDNSINYIDLENGVVGTKVSSDEFSPFISYYKIHESQIEDLI